MEPTLIPRWTYGTACSACPVGPGSATTSPSATAAPRLTRSLPRWVSDTLYSPNEIVTVNPFVGTTTMPKRSATSIFTTPICSPLGPTRRTSGTRIRSFVRGSLMRSSSVRELHRLERATRGERPSPRRPRTRVCNHSAHPLRRRTGRPGDPAEGIDPGNLIKRSTRVGRTSTFVLAH